SRSSSAQERTAGMLETKPSNIQISTLREDWRQLLPFPYGATLTRNDGYDGKKAHASSMDGIVANGTRGLEQRIDLYRLSGGFGPMDQPFPLVDWFCGCSARSVARIWAVNGL